MGGAGGPAGAGVSGGVIVVRSGFEERTALFSMRDNHAGLGLVVFRQMDGGRKPATAESQEGARLAIWQTGLDGLDWLNELVAAGRAIFLGGTGYPLRYTGRAEHVLPPVLDGPPGAHKTWPVGLGDILLPNWEAKTVIDHAAVGECAPRNGY